MGQGDLEKFITGSVGYVELQSGSVASFDVETGREMNAIEALEDAVVSVEQYGDFTDGNVSLVAGQVRFGKFNKVTVTTGSVIVYSSGGVPTIA